LQITFVLVLLAAAMLFFITGWLRYDITALGVLLALLASNTLTIEEGLAGFSNPAVITVIAVLIFSRAVFLTGMTDFLKKGLQKHSDRPALLILSISALAALISAFFNNIGATAMLLPLTVGICHKKSIPPSKALIPLAFGSLMGGMLTLIGTPPNLLISSFMLEYTGIQLNMFDFLLVGGLFTAAGLLLLSFSGNFLLPDRGASRPAAERFEIGKYLTELRLKEEFPYLGESLKQVEGHLGEEVEIINLVRESRINPLQLLRHRARPGDILLVKIEPDELEKIKNIKGLEILPEDTEKGERVEEGEMLEAVVLPDSPLVGLSTKNKSIQEEAVKVLAVSRRSSIFARRLEKLRFKGGDVLLLRGQPEMLDSFLKEKSCLPLAERELHLTSYRELFKVMIIFISCLLLVTLEILPPATGFLLGSFLTVVTGIITPRQAYQAVDWPVVLLIAAMLPMGTAMEKTGAAAWIVETALSRPELSSPPLILLAVIIITMVLSNIINNAATIVLMAPLVHEMARGMAVSPAPLLMGAAFAASAAFLTPIAHQSNALVLEPGNYRFTDYFKAGLPLSLLAVIIFWLTVPLVWPF